MVFVMSKSKSLTELEKFWDGLTLMKLILEFVRDVAENIVTNKTYSFRIVLLLLF